MYVHIVHNHPFILWRSVYKYLVSDDILGTYVYTHHYTLRRYMYVGLGSDVVAHPTGTSCVSIEQGTFGMKD